MTTSPEQTGMPAVGSMSPSTAAGLGPWLRALPLRSVLLTPADEVYFRVEGIEFGTTRRFPGLRWLGPYVTFDIGMSADGTEPNDVRGLADVVGPFELLKLGPTDGRQ